MNYDEYRELSLCDGYLEDNNLWFSNCNFNALCRINLNSMAIEVIDTFQKRKKWKKKLHRKIIGYNDFFYLIPNCGNEIDIYNRITKEQTFAKIPEDFLQNDEYVVSNAFIITDCIWIFPWYSYQPIIVYEINENQFFQETVLTHKLKDFNGTVFSYKSVFLDKDCFWMTILQSNYIICYNWKTKKIKEFRINMDNLYSIYKSNEKIWLGTWNTEVISVWNYKTNQLKQMKTGANINPFFHPIVINNEVYILSKSEEIIHLLEKRVKKIHIEPKGIKIYTKFSFIYTCVYSNNLFLLPYQMKYMIRYDLLNGYAEALDFKIPESFVLNNYYKDYKLPFLRDQSKKKIIYEHDLALEGLEEILELKKEIQYKKCINSGKAIVDFLCSKL
jgi:hypothetical protein